MPSKYRGWLKTEKKKKEETKSEESASPAEAISAEELNLLLSALDDAPPPKLAENPAPATSTAAVISTANEAPKKMHRAQNVFYRDADKKYVLVTIEYDPDSDYTKLVSMDAFADSQPTAIYKLNNLFTMKIIKREER